MDLKVLEQYKSVLSEVNVIARWGMNEDDFKELARIFKLILIDGKDMRNEVKEFRSRFETVNYSFS